MIEPNVELHPEPPSDLSNRPLLIYYSSGPWFRIHQSRYDPLYFGCKGCYRYDAPEKEYKILYMGQDKHCAFIETFGHTTGNRVIASSELEKRTISRIDSKRQLKLVDLTGSGLARIGADVRLTGGEDYALAQRWALALWQHHSKIDGIWYRSRHDPSRFCGALYDDRVSDALESFPVEVQSVPIQNLYDSYYVEELGDILDTYGFGLI